MGKFSLLMVHKLLKAVIKDPSPTKQYVCLDVLKDIPIEAGKAKPIEPIAELVMKDCPDFRIRVCPVTYQVVPESATITESFELNLLNLLIKSYKENPLLNFIPVLVIDSFDRYFCQLEDHFFK